MTAPINLRPLIVAEGSQAIFQFTGLTPGQEYKLALLPAAERNHAIDGQITASPEGAAVWSLPASWKGEALLDLLPGEDDRPAVTLHVFSAPAEIARRRPLRVDFHMHTFHSDGHATPAEMVIRGRELGLDALAITDHNNFAGSQEGAQAASRLGLGLMCLSGEEVTAWDWHVLSIGASAAIGYTQPDGPGYDMMVRMIERIHALGGRAYLAHPYWVSRRQRNMPSADYERILKEGGLDGIELLGDVDWEDNILSLARYHALDNRQRPPILGNSDTHWSDPPIQSNSNTDWADPPILGNPDTDWAGHTFGGFWTLVFAKHVSQDGILTAIADHYSVACGRMPIAPPGAKLDTRLIAFGPFEQVELAHFLERHYYPEHDRLCRLEADLAARRLAGEALPDEAMRQAVMAVEDYARACFQG